MSENKGCSGCGDSLYNLGCWVVLGGVGVFIFVLAYMGIVAQGALETGEMYAQEPIVQEVRETATEAAPSVIGLVVIGAFFVGLAVVAGKIMFGFRE